MAWEWNSTRFLPYAPGPHRRTSQSSEDFWAWLFIASIANHLASLPLTDMLKKDRLFDWTEESTKAFEALKDALSSAPLLIVPDPNLMMTR